MDHKAIDLYNEYIHGNMLRRDFLLRLAGVAGGAAAATALLPLLESNYAWGQQVAPDDGRLETAHIEYPGALTAEGVARVQAPLMLHYAGRDERINQSIPEFRQALDAHGVAYSLHMYPGTEHGFHNDSSQARYNAEAARPAWQRTLAFFGNYL